ncbi:MAG: hypothetical protein IAB78_07620 [Bacteroidetes bacterium]|uniref:Uncharacterized protein n=1 Tax=Candidatus Cryptobacteroides excrementavium TaxID=2840759 RepID=A0A9D9NRW9_9BACT|nr:hypothetical protein [Candidatus Cryptobacteroides excrementavium]
MPQHGAASRSSVADRICHSMGRAGLDTAWRTEYVTAWGCKPQQRG